MNEIEERVLGCFQAVFPSLSDEEIMSMDQPDQPVWDSLASLNLITVIEEEFDLVLSDDAIGEMSTFGKVCGAVQPKAD